MCSVSPFRKGAWIVRWNPVNIQVGNGKDSDAVVVHKELFKCGHRETTYALHVRAIQNDENNQSLFLDLYIEEDDYNEADCPRSVTACFNRRIKNMDRDGDDWFCDWSFSVRSLKHYLRRMSFVQLILEYEERRPEEEVVNHLSYLFHNQLMTDVQFNVQGYVIGAHSNVISANPVMAVMLEQMDSEGQSDTVEITDIELEIFRLLLHYMYTREIPELDDVSMAEKLLSAADKFQIRAIKEACEDFLVPMIHLDNVIRLLVKSYVHATPDLMESCLSFLSNNPNEIWPLPEWKKLVMTYPALFFKASRRMSKE